MYVTRVHEKRNMATIQDTRNYFIELLNYAEKI